MKTFVIGIFLCVFCAQCGRRSAVSYEGSLTAEKEVPLAAAVLNDSFLFSGPEDLMIMDSLLVVHDSYQQTDCFHVFRKRDGAFVRSFGRKGRGPGELTDAGCANGSQDGSVAVYDPGRRKAVVYHVADLLHGRKPGYREYTVEHAPNFIKQALPRKNGFIVKGNDDKLRYGFWNPSTGTFHAIYTEYPRLSEEREDNWSLTDYAVKVRLSPDGRTLVAATYVGAILEIFEVDDRGFDLKTARYFFEPQYGYAQGAKPRWVTTTPQTVIGFDDMFVTDEAIYALVWGIPRKAMEHGKPQLVRFDFNGNPLESYLSDDALETVAADTDGTIYGVGCDAAGQYRLCRYTPTGGL